MKRTLPIFLLLFGLLIFTACSKKQQQQQQIAQLEQALEQAKHPPSDSLLKPLLTEYSRYTQLYPEDEFTPSYLYRMGNIYYRMDNYKEATKHYEYVINQYPNAAAYEQALLLSAETYERKAEVMNKDRAGELYKIYLEKFPDGPGRSQAEFYFSPPEEKAQIRIANYQQELFKDSKGGNMDRKTAHILIRQYLNYIKQYPNSEFAPIYCFEGGELASKMGESLDAVELWTTIYKQYHDFHLYPETILLLAVEYESKMPLFTQRLAKKERYKKAHHPHVAKIDLSDTDWLKKAEEMYKEFLAKYPDHKLAPQVKASLNHLGKTPNEVVEEFKSNLDSLRKIRGSTQLQNQ